MHMKPKMTQTKILIDELMKVFPPDSDVYKALVIARLRISKNAGK